MADRSDLDTWVREALKQSGGRGSIVDVAKFIWQTYESQLRDSGDLFYTWQYDMRWAANRLRRKGVVKPVNVSPAGIWELARP